MFSNTQKPKLVLFALIAITIALALVAALFLMPTTISGEASLAVDGPSSRSLRGHVIIATLRDESDFVVEWINYRWIGFDHVVVFNNDDDTTVLSALLSQYVNEGHVTVIPWTRVGVS